MNHSVLAAELRSLFERQRRRLFAFLWGLFLQHFVNTDYLLDPLFRFFMCRIVLQRAAVITYRGRILTSVSEGQTAIKVRLRKSFLGAAVRGLGFYFLFGHGDRRVQVGRIYRITALRPLAAC